jgi:hypothetical protein
VPTTYRVCRVRAVFALASRSAPGCTSELRGRRRLTHLRGAAAQAMASNANTGVKVAGRFAGLFGAGAACGGEQAWQQQQEERDTCGNQVTGASQRSKRLSAASEPSLSTLNLRLPPNCPVLSPPWQTFAGRHGAHTESSMSHAPASLITTARPRHRDIMCDSPTPHARRDLGPARSRARPLLS